jgi:hypothetical protein
MGFVGGAAGFIFGKNAGTWTVQATKEWAGGKDPSTDWMRNPDGTKKEEYSTFK